MECGARAYARSGRSGRSRPGYAGDPCPDENDSLYAACALRYVGIFRRDLSYRPGGLPYVFIKRS